MAISFAMPRALRRFVADTRGVAAVELALLTPAALLFLALAVFGGEGLSIQRKVTLAARTVTDLVGQISPTSFASSVNYGVISSSTAHHRTSTITAADYKQLGEVTNTPGPAVNNGVVVTLAGHSTWSVTGTSYLTHLTVGANAGVVGANGRHVQMTVDGVPTAISPGHTYTGAVTLSLR